MDCHELVFGFHQARVRVSDEERERLARARDLNVWRVRQGLAALGLPQPLRDRSQGGYAMHTLTRRDDGDQDIDVALVFDANEVAGDPAGARGAVLDAILEVSPPFAREPERRTNAVTVWYADGYHVDFAVYREGRNGMEHAGSRWQAADPSAVVDWFTNYNQRRSPRWHPGDAVKDSQFRRVVRILKFLRQNDDASYPGGYVITALAAENYGPSGQGDDVALLATMQGIAAQLSHDVAIRDPLSPRYALPLRRVDV